MRTPIPAPTTGSPIRLDSSSTSSGSARKSPRDLKKASAVKPGVCETSDEDESNDSSHDSSEASEQEEPSVDDPDSDTEGAGDAQQSPGPPLQVQGQLLGRLTVRMERPPPGGSRTKKKLKKLIAKLPTSFDLRRLRGLRLSSVLNKKEITENRLLEALMFLATNGYVYVSATYTLADASSTWFSSLLKLECKVYAQEPLFASRDWEKKRQDRIRLMMEHLEMPNLCLPADAPPASSGPAAASSSTPAASSSARAASSSSSSAPAPGSPGDFKKFTATLEGRQRPEWKMMRGGWVDVPDSLGKLLDRCVSDGYREAEAPKGLSVELRNYQRQSLAWMLDKERGESISAPFWTPLKFPSGKPYFYCPLTASTRSGRARAPRGGREGRGGRQQLGRGGRGAGQGGRQAQGPPGGPQAGGEEARARREGGGGGEDGGRGDERRLVLGRRGGRAAAQAGARAPRRASAAAAEKKRKAAVKEEEEEEEAGSSASGSNASSSENEAPPPRKRAARGRGGGRGGARGRGRGGKGAAAAAAAAAEPEEAPAADLGAPADRRLFRLRLQHRPGPRRPRRARRARRARGKAGAKAEKGPALQQPKAEEMVDSAATLVVVPVSLLGQWANEIERKCSRKLRVLQYHENRTTSAKALAKCDIVLTTYSILAKVGLTEVDALQKVRWRRIILDESHYIKNAQAKTTKFICSLDAKFRWAASGTPLQNQANDLHTTLAFLKVEPFASSASGWREAVVRPYESLYDAKRGVLLSMLKILMIRHIGSQVMDGAPLVALPRKTYAVQRVEMPPEDAELYARLHALVERKFARIGRSDDLLRSNYVQAMSLLLVLRQFASHPSLVTPEKYGQLVKAVEALASEPEPEGGAPEAGRPAKMPVEEILQKIAQSTNAQEFVVEVQKNIAQLNLIECTICWELCEEPTITPCGHVYCQGCIEAAISRGTNTGCPQCRRPLRHNQLMVVKPPAQPAPEPAPAAAGGADADDFDLKLIAAGQREGPKVRALLAALRGMAEGDKAIVFSSFNETLARIEAALKREAFRYVKIEGSTAAKTRAKALQSFQDDPACRVFLLSVRAGAVGLTLTAANLTFIMEPCLNAGTEAQAVNRVYRIGQTRDVEIVVFATRGTAEERVLQVRDPHPALADSAGGAPLPDPDAPAPAPAGPAAPRPDGPPPPVPVPVPGFMYGPPGMEEEMEDSDSDSDMEMYMARYAGLFGAPRRRRARRRRASRAPKPADSALSRTDRPNLRTDQWRRLFEAMPAQAPAPVAAPAAAAPAGASSSSGAPVPAAR
eukprot:tig00021293_g20000.t1